MVKSPSANAGDSGDTGLIPGSGRTPGEGNGNPLQCSCLENSRDGGAWWAAVCGVSQSQTRLKRLSSSMGTITSRSLCERVCMHVRSSLTLCDPMDTAHQAPLSMEFFKNTGVGCHFLLQRIFPTRGLNLCLLHWQEDSLPLCQY